MKLNTLMWIPLVVSIILFCAAAYLTRADGRRALCALIGGAVASGIGLFLDVCGYWASLWHFLGEYVSHGPWLVYVAVGFAQGAFALIAWHLTRRFSIATLAIFVFFVASVLTSQDYVIASTPYRVQVIAPGLGPAIYDQMLWLLVTSVSVLTLRALSGPVGARAGEPSGEEVAAH